MLRTLLAAAVAVAPLLAGAAVATAAEPVAPPATADRQHDLWDEISHAADAVGRAARDTSAEALDYGQRALNGVDGELDELGRRADAQADAVGDRVDDVDWTEKRLQLELLKTRAELALHRLARGTNDTWDSARAEAAEAFSDLDDWLRENAKALDDNPRN